MKYNRRVNYDPKLMFNEYEAPVKSQRKLSYEQTELIKKMYNSEGINKWERGFLKSVIKFNTLSDLQRTTLRKIYIKIDRLSNK